MMTNGAELRPSCTLEGALDAARGDLFSSPEADAGGRDAAHGDLNPIVVPPTVAGADGNVVWGDWGRQHLDLRRGFLPLRDGILNGTG